MSCSILQPTTNNAVSGGAAASINTAVSGNTAATTSHSNPPLGDLENQVLPGDVTKSITSILSKEKGLIGSITVHNIDTGGLGGISDLSALGAGGLSSIPNNNIGSIPLNPQSPQILDVPASFLSNIPPHPEGKIPKLIRVPSDNLGGLAPNAINVPQTLNTVPPNAVNVPHNIFANLPPHPEGKTPKLVKLSDTEASSVLQNLNVKTPEGQASSENESGDLPPRIIILVKNEDNSTEGVTRSPRFIIPSNHQEIQSIDVTDNNPSQVISKNSLSKNNFVDKDTSELEKMLSMSFGPENQDIPSTSLSSSSSLVDTPDMSKLPLEKTTNSISSSSIPPLFPPFDNNNKSQQQLQQGTQKHVK